VLDLFAGTGALGLEAASRGASTVWLIDNHAGATAVLDANIALVAKPLSHAPMLRSVTSSVAKFLAGAARSEVSIVFLDPPYDYPKSALDDHLVALGPWLAPGALVVVERSSKGAPPEFPESYEVLSPKTYGDTTVYWARFLKGSQPPT
jgi:N6-adenine-specific methylase